MEIEFEYVCYELSAKCHATMCILYLFRLFDRFHYLAYIFEISNMMEEEKITEEKVSIIPI